MASSKKQTKKKTSEFLDALRFIGLVQKPEGKEYETHCQMAQGFISAGDSILAAGSVISSDLDATLPTYRLLRALESCDEAVTLTQDEHRIRIQSGAFKATLTSLENEIPVVPPDPMAGPASDALRVALGIVAPLVADSAPRLIDASILMRSGSVVGTNSKTLLEAWHGISMPTVVVPKLFATALSKTSKVITSFGYSDRSFTVWFEDRSWLRTQLFDAAWPDIDPILTPGPYTEPIPEDFFDAARRVALFGNGDVITDQALVRSRDMQASYELKSPMAAMTLCGEQLERVEKYAKQYSPTDKCMLIFSDGMDYNIRVRGAVSFVA